MALRTWPSWISCVRSCTSFGLTAFLESAGVRKPHPLSVQVWESLPFIADRTEYLDKKATEFEPMRYVSGHKTSQFESADFRTAIFVHSDRDEVLVSRASCTGT